ncbi:MAG: hypothetical protein IJC28_05735 [Mailhella sp.]|nr:hypothetical protein [Mailhella sp.]
MFTAVLYGAALGLLLLSWRKSPQKTRAALKKAWKSCTGVLPLFFAILLCMGFLLSFVDEAVIQQAVGRESGMAGIVLSGVIGSVTLIPAFAAYPAAAELLRVTGGYAQITMLITSLMMVGLVTLPLECRFFGLKAAVWRNALGLAYSFALAVFMGMVFGGM